MNGRIVERENEQRQEKRNKRTIDYKQEINDLI